MKKLLYFIIFALLLAGLVCVAAACGADGVGESETQSQSESNSEINGESGGDGVLTLILTKDNGDRMANIEIVLYSYGEPVATVFTDDDGKVDIELPEGEYFLDFTGLPENHLALRSFVEMGSEDMTVDVSVLDNTPDGSVGKPFFIYEEKTEMIIPSGTEYNFHVNATVEVTVEITGGFEVSVFTYDDNGELHETVYAPNHSGVVTFNAYTGDPNTKVRFDIANYGEERVAEITLKMPLGSMENPIPIESLEELLIVSVANDETVYYSWTATDTGVLVVESLSAEAELILNRITEVEGETLVEAFDPMDGEELCMINVNEGDVIRIAITSTSGAADIVLSFTFSQG